MTLGPLRYVDLYGKSGRMIINNWKKKNLLLSFQAQCHAEPALPASASQRGCWIFSKGIELLSNSTGGAYHAQRCQCLSVACRAHLLPSPSPPLGPFPPLREHSFASQGQELCQVILCIKQRSAAPEAQILFWVARRCM